MQRLPAFALALLCASPAAAICDSPPDPNALCGHATVVRGRALGPGEHSLEDVAPQALVVEVAQWSGRPQQGIEDGAIAPLLQNNSGGHGFFDLFAGNSGEVMVFLVDESTYLFALAVDGDDVILAGAPGESSTTVPVADTLSLAVDPNPERCVEGLYEVSEPELFPYEGGCNDEPGSCSQGPGAAMAALSLFLLLLRRRR